jgi:DNA-directed RNA polymerase subunit RPC12/RpoP
MIHIKVNGGQYNAICNDNDEVAVNEIINRRFPGALDDRHEQLCNVLKIGRFQPSTTHPYALVRTPLEFVNESHQSFASVGGGLVCAKCFKDIEPHYVTVECPHCRNTKIPNYKPVITPMKRGNAKPPENKYRSRY